MTFYELKSTIILALIFACRLLGLFMILPVLALYTEKIPGATPILIGLAAGIYGFTQALLQLPCGFLSDYFGRKPVIIGGLLIFILGSLIAAFNHSIQGLIIGRAIQGAGAIGAPILALVADITREQVRTRAMALIGISIGFTFILAILLGPLLEAYMGLYGIFIFTALLAGGGLLLLLLSLGSTPLQPKPADFKTQFQVLWHHRDLWRLNSNIFILHAILTACFLVLPKNIQSITGLTSHQWYFYLPVLVGSVLLITPFLRSADRLNQHRKRIKFALSLLAVTTMIMLKATQLSTLIISVTLFFAAFNFLEASFPALVSRVAPQASKGTALGVYSSSQFLGMFAGGVLGGCLQQWFDAWGIGIGCLLLAATGWLAIQRMDYLRSDYHKTKNVVQVTG